MVDSQEAEDVLRARGMSWESLNSALAFRPDLLGKVLELIDA